MPDLTPSYLWASPPGETIRALLQAKGVSISVFQNEIGLNERQTTDLLAGVLPVTRLLAEGLAETIGSTSHFWLERQKQYTTSLERLAAAQPELQEWTASFPLRKMVESGWLKKPYTKSDSAFELLDYFDIESVEEWRERYPERLGAVKFKTSEAFTNHLPTTVAWIRRGEILADGIACAPWDGDGFLQMLPTLKRLSKLPDPGDFLPLLQASCAQCGVAVVVARSIVGCAASGAAFMLSEDKALLLLSARFLSDDQFWFSFFHEAGHLVLHHGEAHIECDGGSTVKQEDEANAFALEILLGKSGPQALQKLPINAFAIARFARQCGVSTGVVVGQLQRSRISPKLFNRFKNRYRAESFSL